MRQRKLASGYVARTYGALRCFFGFLSRERLIPQNPFALIAKPAAWSISSSSRSRWSKRDSSSPGSTKDLPR